MNTNASHFCWAVCAISLGFLSGCGMKPGPGSQADWMRFANVWINHLNAPPIRSTIRQDNGKWVGRERQVRKARAGFVETQNSVTGTHQVEGKVEYEFRMVTTDPCETKADAEAAEITNDDSVWDAKAETWVFDDGKWVQKDAQ